jgi:hypothetical protein
VPHEHCKELGFTPLQLQTETLPFKVIFFEDNSGIEFWPVSFSW